MKYLLCFLYVLSLATVFAFLPSDVRAATTCPFIEEESEPRPVPNVGLTGIIYLDPTTSTCSFTEPLSEDYARVLIRASNYAYAQGSEIELPAGLSMGIEAVNDGVRSNGSVSCNPVGQPTEHYVTNELGDFVTCNLSYVDRYGEDVSFNIRARGADFWTGNPGTSFKLMYLLVNEFTISNGVFSDTAPDLVISGPQGPINAATEVTFTFANNVSDFDASDVTVSGGMLSDFAGSNKIFTATVTPTESGPIVVSVPAGAAANVNGKTNNEASYTVTGDLDDPILSVDGLPDPMTGSATARFNFSEPVFGFGADDVTVTNATIANLTGSGDSYTATITPINAGPVTVDIPANIAQDLAGNGNVSASVTVDSDRPDSEAPTVTIGGLTEAMGLTTPITFTFSEPVSGFTVDDLVLIGDGSLTGFFGSAESYGAVLRSNCVNCTHEIRIGADVAQDVNGNSNMPASAAGTVVDADLPRVIEFSSFTGVISQPIDVGITFSEAVTGFDLSDLVASGGSLSELAGSGANYTVMFTPTSAYDGPASITVRADAVIDAALNANPVATANAQIDTKRPEVISMVQTAGRGGRNFDITFTTDEPIVGLGDITHDFRYPCNFNIGLPFCSVSILNVASSGSQTTVSFELQGAHGSGGFEYLWEFLPVPAPHYIDVVLESSSFSDAYGNAYVGSETVRVEITDGARPYAIILGVGEGMLTSRDVTFQFFSNVENFTLDDVVVTGGVLTDFRGSHPEYQATLLPDLAGGPITVEIPARSIQSPTGTLNRRAYTASGSALRDDPPTVTIGGVGYGMDGDTPVSFLFSEEVTGFDASDVLVEGGTLTNFTGSDDSYSATITPDGGRVTVNVTIPAGAAQDLRGQDSIEQSAVGGNFEDDPPVITVPADISVVPEPGETTAMVEFEVAAHDEIDGPLTPVITTAPTEGLSSGDPFPSGETVVTVTATDTNGNSAQESFTITVADVIAPVVTITGLPDMFERMEMLSATITFSETVVEFDETDLLVEGGSLTTLAAITGNPLAFSAQFMPDGSGHLVVSIADGAVQDQSGNDLVGTSARSMFQSATIASRQIAQFMQNRANALLSHQPDIAGFLRARGTNGSFNAQSTQGSGTFDFRYGRETGLWVQLNGSQRSTDSADTDYLFGAIGSHRWLSDHALIGVMAQIDHAEEQSGASRVSGEGWLAGIYAASRLAEQPLYFSGSLLYGQTENSISPTGFFTDSFSTERWLATANIEGEVLLERITFIPNFGLSYTTDHQQSYRDSLGNPVPGQELRLGEVTLGSDFEYPVATASGQLTFTGGLSGIWSHSSGTGAVATVVPAFDGGRARLDLGLTYHGDGGTAVSLGGFHDGLGSDGYDASGIDFEVKIVF